MDLRLAGTQLRLARPTSPPAGVDGITPTRAAGTRDDPMTLRELLETLKCFGVKIALHDGDTITIEPPDVLTPALRAALAEHDAALVALIRSGPSSTSSFDTLMTALDGLAARGESR